MNADEKEVERLFAGQWEHVKQVDIDKFLDAIGIGAIKKTAIMKMSPTQTIAVVCGKDNEYTIDITIAGGPMNAMKQSTSSKLGKSHKVTGLIEGTAVTEFKDGVLISKMQPDEKSKKEQTVTRKIVDGQLEQTMECDGKKGIRYFKKKA